MRSLEISELGCADRCGREMGAENCADASGRPGCKGVLEMVGRRSRWRSASLAAQTAADGVGARELLEMGGDRAGDERAWLRGRLRTGNGCGELRGRLRTAWVQGSGWKLVGRSRW